MTNHKNSDGCLFVAVFLSSISSCFSPRSIIQEVVFEKWPENLLLSSGRESVAVGCNIRYIMKFLHEKYKSIHFVICFRSKIPSIIDLIYSVRLAPIT